MPTAPGHAHWRPSRIGVSGLTAPDWERNDERDASALDRLGAAQEALLESREVLMARRGLRTGGATAVSVRP
jgi:hypothetical protein